MEINTDADHVISGKQYKEFKEYQEFKKKNMELKNNKLYQLIFKRYRKVMND